MGSPSKHLGSADWKHILEVLAFTVCGSIVTFVLQLIPTLHTTGTVTVLVPVFTTALVSLQRFLQDRSHITES